MLKDIQHMTKTRQIVLIILTVAMLTSCNFISNYFNYRDTTKQLINDILKQDYDSAIKLFALERPSFAGTANDSLKARLPVFRGIIVNNFGEHLDYTMMTAEKKWSTVEEENTPPNTTVVLMQFANDKEFGVLKVWFDDISKKVVYIKTLDIRQPIPSMTIFWLFGLIPLCVLGFNIYVIRKIKRSDLKKKWLKYIAVTFLNVPAITYAAVNGFSFSLLSFQFLLGVSFSYMGYLSSSWTFGIPLGGLYWFWKLSRPKIEIAESEATIDQNIATEV